MHEEFDVSISNHGVLRRRARVHGKEALEVIIPVEEVGLKVDDAVEWDVSCFGAGEVEIGESSAAADGAGHNVVWM